MYNQSKLDNKRERFKRNTDRRIIIKGGSKMNYHDLTIDEQRIVDVINDINQKLAEHLSVMIDKHINDCLTHVIDNHYSCNEFRVIEVESMLQDTIRNMSAFNELQTNICTLIDNFGAENYPINI